MAESLQFQRSTQFSAADFEFSNQARAEPLYYVWEQAGAVEYPCADANFVNADVSIVNDISIIDNYFLEALEEFSEDCLNLSEQVVSAPEAVALPVEQNPSQVFAFAVPEVYLPGYSEQLVKSDDMIKQFLFDDFETELKTKEANLKQDITGNNIISYINNSSPEKSYCRKSALFRWREKREKKKQQLRDGVKDEPVVTARQIAASRRVRENGKFKKLSIKWIPASDFRAIAGI
jgi:hypothetical protein